MEDRKCGRNDVFDTGVLSACALVRLISAETVKNLCLQNMSLSPEIATFRKEVFRLPRYMENGLK